MRRGVAESKQASAHGGPVRSRSTGLRARVRELAVAQRPSASIAGVVAVSAAVLVSFFAPTGRPHTRVIELLVWGLADIVGAAAYVVGIGILAWLVRNERFERTFSGRLFGLVFGGYALAAVICSTVQAFVHDMLRAADAPADGALLFAARALVFFVIGAALNAFLALRNRIDEQEVALRERVADLDRARSLLARADEKIRREAAEVLHGRVQSRLLAAQVRVERVAGWLGVDDEASRKELAEVVQVLDDLRVNDVRATSHRLHPPSIKVGLMAAVRSLAATFEGAFGLEIEMQVSPGVLELDDPMRSVIDEDMRLVIYRTMEEALSNAHRHGKATHVDVELSLLPGHRLQLKVTDDGVGFETEQFNFGVGVASVAARIEDRGGAWWISSAPGQGTVFSAVMAAPRPVQPEITAPKRTAASSIDGDDAHPISVEAIAPRRMFDAQHDPLLPPPLPPPATGFA